MIDRGRDHRYAGRRRAIHGAIPVRGKSTRTRQIGLVALLPSTRLLQRSAATLVVGSMMTVSGFAGADTVNETSDDDLVIETGAEDDDVEIVGHGADTVSTGGGDDEVVITGDGDNTVSGDEGADFIEIYGDGSNTVSAGDGEDAVFIGGEGEYTIDGDAGDDRIFVDGHRRTVVDGGTGDDDIFVGGNGDNLVDGGEGDDQIRVHGSGENEITGGTGNDMVFAGMGDDTVDGGDGNDWIEGDNIAQSDGLDGGDDIIRGGDGNDAVFGDGFQWEEPCLPAGSAECGDDTIDGGAGHDWVEGGLGDDTVDGGGGMDLVVGDDFLLHYYTVYVNLLSETFRGEANGIANRTEVDLTSLLGFVRDAGLQAPGGDDVLSGGAGADIVAGLNGNDVVCGDAEDIAVLGGGGTDVPCAVFEETLDASGGSATGDLSSGLRDLDDEAMEVDENGVHNPYEYVIDAAMVSSSGGFDTYKTAKGTVVINRNTGAFTYTADPGATGTEDIAYTVRRRVVECADLSAFDLQYEAYQPGCDDGDVVAAGIVSVDGDHLNSLWRIFSVFLGEPVIPVDPVMPVQAVVPARAFEPVQLPETGSDPEDLAVAGLALLCLGGLATAESRRRLRSVSE